MEDVTDNRLARGPRERLVNCGNCLYWGEAEEDGCVMVCEKDGAEALEGDHCDKWEEA